MNISQIANTLREFAGERDWNKFHTPKNIATSITVEAAELLELYQWSVGSSGWDELNDPDLKAKTTQELADVLIYLIRFADLAGIDLNEAVKNKIELNKAKYPVDKFKGSDRKYTEG